MQSIRTCTDRTYVLCIGRLQRVHTLHCYGVENKERIHLKSVQILEELFMKILKYHRLGVEEESEGNKNGLNEKLEAMERNQLYTKYKTDKNDVEKQKVRKRYVDKKGVLESFVFGYCEVFQKKLSYQV